MFLLLHTYGRWDVIRISCKPNAQIVISILINYISTLFLLMINHINCLSILTTPAMKYLCLILCDTETKKISSTLLPAGDLPNGKWVISQFHKSEVATSVFNTRCHQVIPAFEPSIWECYFFGIWIDLMCFVQLGNACSSTTNTQTRNYSVILKSNPDYDIHRISSTISWNLMTLWIYRILLQSLFQIIVMIYGLQMSNSC